MVSNLFPTKDRKCTTILFFSAMILINDILNAMQVNNDE